MKIQSHLGLFRPPPSRGEIWVHSRTLNFAQISERVVWEPQRFKILVKFAVSRPADETRRIVFGVGNHTTGILSVLKFIPIGEGNSQIFAKSVKFEVSLYGPAGLDTMR